MAKFVCDAEVLEALVVDVGGVGDPVAVPDPDQHSRNAAGARRFGCDRDAEIVREGNGIHR